MMGGWLTARWLVRTGVALALGMGLATGPVPFGPRTAQADTLTVTSTADDADDAPGDGRCRTSAGTCTLRAAIDEANALPGADTITFAVNGTITIGPTLVIVSDITINGNGPTRTVLDGGGADRVLLIAPNTTVELRRLTIQHGVDDGGGGLISYGRLTLMQTTIRDNRARQYDGGGLINLGTLTITSSTVSDNRADGSGGGICNDGSLTITNSTISGNRAGEQGGGICNNGRLKLLFSTLSGNRAGGEGGGLYTDNEGDTVARATIIANSAGGGDCGGSRPTSSGYNLDSDGSCRWSGTGDRSNVDPKLGPLADNGGPTLTHALLIGSPALDLVATGECPSTDQRGVRRPQDGDGDGIARCDSGAYERAQQSDEKQERLTELQQLQREHTNALGFDAYRTEGDVLAVDCEIAPAEVVLANLDGQPTVRLLGEAAQLCRAIRPGDYLEVEGEKINDVLFEARHARLERRRR